MNEPTPTEISKVMAAFGRKGGSVTSPAKKRSGRRNMAKALKARLAKQKKTKQI